MRNNIDRAKDYMQRGNHLAASVFLAKMEKTGEVCYLLACCYDELYGLYGEIPNNPVEELECADDYYTQAADLEYPQAMYKVALLKKDELFYAYGEEDDPEKIRGEIKNLFLKAAKHGNSHAALEVYNLYKDDEIEEMSAEEAFEYLILAAKDDCDALAILADCYTNGMDTPKDLEKAYGCYLRLLETDRYPDICKFGKKIILGDTFNKDYALARKCFEKCIEGEYYLGAFLLGYMYENGIGVDIDIYKALELYDKSIKIEKNSFAAYRMAMIYATEEFENRNRALNLFGYLYKNQYFENYYKDDTSSDYVDFCGLRTIKNNQLALIFKAKLKEVKTSFFARKNRVSNNFNILHIIKLLGDVKFASYHLGKMFYRGYPFQNIEISNSLLEESLNEGNLEAAKLLADRLFDTNPEKAFSYYKLGVDKFDPHCMGRYACMLYMGLGCKKNKKDAKVYFKLAVQLNDEDTINFLKENGDIL